ncbi:Piso0_001397 [Millerozyma farinosa CBS 7064]|uniref:Peptidyl-prolyl cis-trans isomerase n=1 Tax=Pichia sorbitophila (strain ATCC MYA-4447 / BCRC 22081 / CBS 7064 / NBRC 10061 / NRRL Y-12695) TaxID=559304 RepID=G8YN22_PICSO|nr:Piso0_001397 [Millerozyma farinosa CBS 7064]
MNPIVFFDLSVQGLYEYLGRVKFELFAEELPITTENFRQFCTGEYRENGIPIGYKGSTVHRVIRGFMIQGGDFVRRNGTGSTTIYGRSHFPDEGFTYDHKKYYLSMANTGPNTNGCQFFICCRDLPHLDGKHVVFGKVVEGFDIIHTIESVETDAQESPKSQVLITNCGEM